jgi:hypothetical protein
MTQGYHLIQFIPDPLVETRITIGALVHDGAQWRFAAAPAGEGVLPVATSREATSLFRTLVADLQTLEAPALPMSLGPHVAMHQRLAIPAGVDEPVDWVVRTSLSPKLDPVKGTRLKGPRRATVGMRFLREQKVETLVKRSFTSEMVNAKPHLVKPATHYVRGSDRTLLLEPIIVDAPRFQQELQDISNTLLAWDSLKRMHQAPLEFRVYALSGSRRNYTVLADACDELGVPVVDTTEAKARARFVDEIRDTSASFRLEG